MTERDMFEAALELPLQKRVAYLDSVCGGDAALRQRLEALLRKHDQAGSFLEAPAAKLVATIDEDSISELPGTVIGPYKLMEQIGEGGMGMVFVAEQQQPIRRKVALKVIKPGMDTRQVVARFEAERQALALMDHPNIAKVHDGGETAGGRPYFVMELVKGVPITQFCDQNQVPIRERLELFLSICQAVQHAHQKGIIHRDLKPSNVLVMSHDGAPVVKVIDFGVAKAIGQHLTDKTIYTQFSQMVGTPLYMSPEQAGQSGLDVDTRSDIYSLGVLLYELLTGTTPFDQERLKEVGYDELRRIIREEEPPRPSTRISTLGQAATTISTQRRSDPKRLSQLFRGELDWVVMKCLEKDRNRRYESASALAADVVRYLKDEPVHACPPSTWYVVRKLAWRYRAGLATGAMFVFLLVAGIVFTTWQAIRANKEEARAVGEGEKAKMAAAKAEAINNFWIKDVLEQGLPNNSPVGAKLTVQELVDKAAVRMEENKTFQEQPEVEAAVRMSIGAIYRELRLLDKAAPHVRRALEIRREVLGPEHPETLSTAFYYVDMLHLQGQVDEAVTYARQTLPVMRRVLGEDHPEFLKLQSGLGFYLVTLGNWEEAEHCLIPALEGLSRIREEADEDTLRTLHYLGILRWEQGRLAEALPIMRECVRRWSVPPRGPKQAETLFLSNYVAGVLLDQGKWAEAEQLARQNLDDSRHAAGPEHVQTAFAMTVLGWALLLQGRLGDAEPVFREELKTQLHSSVESATLSARSDLGALLYARGQLDEAERLFNEVLKARPVYRSIEDDWGTLIALRCLPLVLQARGKWEESEGFFKKVRDDMRRHRGSEHPDTLLVTFNLAVLLQARGKGTEAEPLFREALAGHRKVYPPEHPWTAVTLYGWGSFLLEKGEFKQAEQVLNEALPIQRKALVKDHVATGQTLIALGWALAKSGNLDAGESHLREGLKICCKTLPLGDWFTADAESRLGGCLAARRQYKEAEPLLLRGYKGLESARVAQRVSETWPIRCTLPCPGLHSAAGAPPLCTQQALDRIIALYESWGKADKVAQWKAKRTAARKTDLR